MPRKDVDDPVINQQRQDRFLRWRSGVRLLLIIEIIGLGCLAYCTSLNAEYFHSWMPTGEGENPQLQILQMIVMVFVLEILLLAGLAFLTGAAFSPMQTSAFGVRFLLAWIAASIMALGMILVFQTTKHGLPVLHPSFILVIISALVSAWGAWLGATWMRSRSFFKWYFLQTFVSMILTVGGLYVLTQVALSDQAVDIVERKADSDDRRHLVELFKSHDPRDLQKDETGQLSLSEVELGQLLSWGLSLIPGEHRGTVTLRKNEPELRISIQFPENPFVPSHLNVSTAGIVSTHDGVLGYQAIQFVVGQITLSPEFLKLCGPILIGKQLYSPMTERFLKSVKQIEVNQGLATMTYGHLDVNRENLREALLEFGLIEDLEPAIAIHVDNLIQQSEKNSALSFEECVQVVFSKAKERSIDGDPVKENRAAILALGYVLGHQKLRLFLGDGVSKLSDNNRQKFRKITLRNRQDWTQHFCVSAALQVLGNSAVSMDVGILKEELDADGGSGFSFGDLLADRSGTTFAAQATSLEINAAEFQNLLSVGFKESDYIPDGSDLPEGLTDKDFQIRYGGVQGEGYQKLLDEIDRRIKKCPGYQRN